MHILGLLGSEQPLGKHPVIHEYRLVCSGMLYNSRILTADWSKSNAAAILLEHPIFLAVCGMPLDYYPQELALRFTTSALTESQGNSSWTYHPDNETAAGLTALLSVLLRRLITVTRNVREIHPEYESSHPFHDYPLPISAGPTPVHWREKPASVGYNAHGEVVEITHYNPPPLGVNPAELRALLLGLGKSSIAPAVVLSASLYRLALEHLEQNPELAYQLLIAAVEASASEWLQDYEPSDDEKAGMKSGLVQKAKQFGLTDGDARELAIEACKGSSWTTRKFQQFLIKLTDTSLWTEDDLFKVPENFLPAEADFPDVLRHIYSARGALAHGGRRFPPSIAIGAGPLIPASALRFDWSDKPFPPVVWFERVVNLALTNLIKASREGSDGESSPS
jgi:hypothetical protein